jgi:hypothetical protein
MPTEAEVQTTLNDCFRILDEFLLYSTSNSEKFADGTGSHEGLFLAGLVPDYKYHRDMVAAVEDFRGGLDTQLDFGSRMIEAAFREYAAVADIPETDIHHILDRLWDRFQVTATKQTVKTRAFTFGTPTALTANNGDIICNRLKVDKYGKDLEAQTPDAKVATCISDEASGAKKWEELWEIRGREAGRDRLLIPGSGLVRNIKALSARDSLRFLTNPSFDQIDGTAGSPNSIPGWLGPSTANIAAMTLDSTIYYRDYSGSPATSYSLKWTSSTGQQSFELNQDLKDRNASLRPNVPLYVQIAVYKPATGGTGAIELDLGAVAIASVNIADLNVAGWTVIRLATGVSVGGGTKNWYDNFRTSSPLNIDITVNTADLGRVLYFDDIIIAPFSPFDGDWYTFCAGSTTSGNADKPLRDDQHTWSDSATDSIVQKWLWRLFKRWLPHSSSPSWADPS